MNILSDPVFLEAFFIFLLILFNGFFSGAEIAVISARRSVISRFIQEKKHGASYISDWLKEPEIFLATVQIGITLVGAMASALAGAAAIEHLKPIIQKIDFLSSWSSGISVFLISLVITYFTLVFGELVPKSLALSYKERMALRVAVPIYWLSQITAPFVSMLTTPTRGILKLMRIENIPKEMFVSEDEIRFLIKEGARQGVFDQTEQLMIPKIFDFAETEIQAIMIPREKITAINSEISTDRLLETIAEEAYTRLPVYQGNLDQVLGILHLKDFVYMLTMEKVVIFQDLLRPAVFVSQNMLAKDLLKLFQKRHLHMAIVQDEDKRTVGLITLEDLIEKIVGDIQDEQDNV